ncbi:MAG: hypothetical protein ACXWCX_26210, partial [Burkholderiales bacterium]
MNAMHVGLTVLALCMVGCVPLSFRTETPYPGSGAGRIVSTSGEPGPIPAADRPKPIMVPVQGVLVPIPGESADIF